MFRYSRSVLLAIRPVSPAIGQDCLKALQRIDWPKIHCTRRGTKAGRGSVRRIPCVTGNRFTCTSDETKAADHNGVNADNLIQLITSNGLSALQTPSIGHAAPAYVSAIETLVQPRKDTSVRNTKPSVLHANLIRPTMVTYSKTVVPLNLISLNCRSVKNKALSISDFITSKDIDILALTETWLGTNIDNQVLAELIPPGYDIILNSRQERRGGGVGVLFKKNLNVRQLASSQDDVFTHFEHLSCSVCAGDVQIRLCIIYRPPPSKRNGFRNTLFFEEWSNYLDHQVVIPQEIIITGDLNFHLDDLMNADSRHFSELLDARGLVQHVTEATHVHGHTLDVVITRENSSIIHGVPSVIDPYLSDIKGNPSGDHLAVHTSLSCGKPGRIRKEVSFRKYREISVPDFIRDIESSHTLQATVGGVDDLVEAFNSGIRDLIDKHAPLQTKVITKRPNAPWYTEELREAKQKRRKAERKWRRTKLIIHQQIYKDQCRLVGLLLVQAKKNYYSDKIAECGTDHKQLFRLTKNLMGQNGDVILPSCSSEKILSNKFSNYFLNKITTIRTNIGSVNSLADSDNLVMTADIPFDGEALTQLTPTTEDEVRKIITNSPSKSCELDPLPTSLLKQCLEALLPLITLIMNKSLAESKVPLWFKKANVKPLIKKSGLDKEELKNYRPVSNLPFLSKILEKIVSKRLELHLQANSLHDNLQSAYRTGHSTETALLRVHNDIVAALDNKCRAVLVMLDLSAAFDVIDHGILFKRLDYSYGVTGNALRWIQSYLSDRRQCVAIGSVTSDDKILEFGVPQGSVLGPRKYCLYSKPIGEICRRHNLLYHCYADDTQIYMVIRPQHNWDTIAHNIEACLVDISAWMNANMLKLNQDKTELIVFAPKHQPAHDIQLNVGIKTIKAAPVVKNLGVHFDSSMTMEKQVNAIAKSCYYQLRNIGRIRQFITTDACKTLLHSLVTSRLDYGNALLYGISDSATRRLQKVQNTAARLVSSTSKREHITPVLYSLHWLPVHYRPQYKILMHTYKALYGTAPSYLTELVTPYQPSRSLRSEAETLLCVPKSRTVTYGDRCFGKVAATLWNNLPSQTRKATTLTTFKKGVKTHLFRRAFS